MELDPYLRQLITGWGLATLTEDIPRSARDVPIELGVLPVQTHFCLSGGS